MGVSKASDDFLQMSLAIAQPAVAIAYVCAQTHFVVGPSSLVILIRVTIIVCETLACHYAH